MKHCLKHHLMLLASLLPVATVFAQNPYLPLWEHLPDGEPRVFEDPDHPGQMRAYIIGSHDLKNTEYCGPDIRMWSAPVENLTQWRDEGSIFTHYVDGEWDTMYAPDLVEVKDKQTGKRTYYLYPHSRGWRRVPMVAKSDRPDGPFTPVNLSPDGRQCLEGSFIDFDPSVYIEEVTSKRDADFDIGFRAYVYYGFQHSTAVELDQHTMYSPRPGKEMLDFFIPASNTYGEVRDPEGTRYPALCEGQNPADFNFFEASSIRRVGNKYVMVFSGHSGPDYGLWSSNSTLRYAYGDSPLGPWRSGGVLVDSRGVVPNEDGTHLTTTNSGHNTHGSLQEINGQWYVFYHRPPRGFGFARQSMVAPVRIEWDKKPVAKGGQVRICGYDPFAKDERWVASATDGHTYTGAEVTSEGFNIFGLPPYHYYSAGIAAYMSDQQWLQDNFDVWNDGMDLAGIRNGGIVGFKYFGFGSLEHDTKGVPSFRGTQKGDGTQLKLFLTQRAEVPFKIHVMLDGPYDNDIWKGREIATLEIPANGAKWATEYSIKVPEVEGLTGKHAIYLVAEGPEVREPERPQWQRPQRQRPYGLFDLHGIAFCRQGEECHRPRVPQLEITVDGTRVIMPSFPILSTNQNGYTDLGHYQLYARMTDSSIIQATCKDPEVQITIGKVTDGRATIRATYHGVQKVFLLN